jgi:hypothetical protein
VTRWSLQKSVVAGELEHLVGHVHAVSLAPWRDPPRRKQDVYAASTTEVEHDLPRRERRQGGGVTAPQGRGARRLGQPTQLLGGVAASGPIHLERLGVKATLARRPAARRRPSPLQDKPGGPRVPFLRPFPQLLALYARRSFRSTLLDRSMDQDMLICQGQGTLCTKLVEGGFSEVRMQHPA